MQCPNCRAQNPDGAATCMHCGVALANPFAPPQAVFQDPTARPAPANATDETVATIIPYKNAAALMAYYLGLFSCFPLLGLPLAIVALVMGIKGLKTVRLNPQAHGTAHAWIGLVCGTIGLLINGVITLVLIIGLIGMAAERR